MNRDLTQILLEAQGILRGWVPDANFVENPEGLVESLKQAQRYAKYRDDQNVAYLSALQMEQHASDACEHHAQESARIGRAAYLSSRNATEEENAYLLKLAMRSSELKSKAILARRALLFLPTTVEKEDERLAQVFNACPIPRLKIQ